MTIDGLSGPGTDPLIFRRTLGKFVTGVTIVGTRDGSGKRWGMTANSFSSVSLDPPLVSICIADRSPSFPAFRDSEHFGVSILTSSQQDVALRFAKPFDDKFDGLSFDEPLAGAPVLPDSAGTLSCRRIDSVIAGDHVILIGQVLECSARGGSLLGYGDGRFLTIDTVENTGTLAPRSGREVDFGWLLEQDGRLLLWRDKRTGKWTVPIGALREGSTMSESMSRSARLVLGVEVEPVFLYSTLDLSADRTCYVYRALPLDVLPTGSSWRLFGEDEVPWGEFLHPTMVPMVERYFVERASDQFGIFLNLGEGRIAQIASESRWPSR